MKKSQGNLIAIMTLALLFAFAAEAGVLVRTNGTTQYIPGQKAVGPNIDTDFNNIVSWINGANISSSNIAEFGLLPSNLPEYNLTVTNGSTAFTTGGPVPVAVPNLTVTFNASGFRPVKVSLEPNPNPFTYNGYANYGSMIVGVIGLNSDVTNVYMVRDGQTTSNVYVNTNPFNEGSPPLQNSIPCSALTYTDQPLAGNHTYTIYASASTSRGSIGVFNCRMVVEEL